MFRFFKNTKVTDAAIAIGSIGAAMAVQISVDIKNLANGRRPTRYQYIPGCGFTPIYSGKPEAKDNNTGNSTFGIK